MTYYKACKLTADVVYDIEFIVNQASHKAVLEIKISMSVLKDVPFIL